jgi:hypothetical protein
VRSSTRDGASASGEQLVEIAARDPHTIADAQRRQRPLSDPIADRLLVELEHRGDLSDRHQLITRCFGHNSPPDK